MTWPTVVIIAAAITAGVATEILRRKRLAPLLGRACAGRHWRETFPAASKADIREFLQIFVDSFALRRKHSLAFQPHDRIIDVYHALNPPELCVADALELETLAKMVQDRYGLDLGRIWRVDLTLGELFTKVRAA